MEEALDLSSEKILNNSNNNNNNNVVRPQRDYHHFIHKQVTNPSCVSTFDLYGQGDFPQPLPDRLTLQISHFSGKYFSGAL